MANSENILIVKIESDGKHNETFLRKELKPETKISDLIRKVEKKLSNGDKCYTHKDYNILYIDPDGKDDIIDDIEENNEMPLSQFCTKENILYIEVRPLGLLSKIAVTVTNKTSSEVPIIQGNRSRWEYHTVKQNYELGFELEKDAALNARNSKGNYCYIHFYRVAKSSIFRA